MSAELLDSTVLELAAVLGGLVGDNFEILVVDGGLPATREATAALRANAPGLPLRVVDGNSIAAGCEAAECDLIFVSAADGQYDVRELNRLLDAIEDGADIAAGYRPRATDGLFRQLQRWGWRVNVDCAFQLIRSGVWQHLAREERNASCAELLSRLRRLGYRVAEVPVRDRRPIASVRAA